MLGSHSKINFIKDRPVQDPTPEPRITLGVDLGSHSSTVLLGPSGLIVGNTIFAILAWAKSVQYKPYVISKAQNLRLLQVPAYTARLHGSPKSYIGLIAGNTIYTAVTYAIQPPYKPHVKSYGPEP